MIRKILRTRTKNLPLIECYLSYYKSIIDAFKIYNRKIKSLRITGDFFSNMITILQSLQVLLNLIRYEKAHKSYNNTFERHRRIISLQRNIKQDED